MLSAQSEFSYLAKAERITNSYFEAFLKAPQHSKDEISARELMYVATFAAHRKFTKKCGLVTIHGAEYEHCLNGTFNHTFFMRSSVNVMRVGAMAIAADLSTGRQTIDTQQNASFPFMYCGLQYGYATTETKHYTGFSAYGYVHAKIDYIPQDHLVLIPLEALTIHEYPAINN